MADERENENDRPDLPMTDETGDVDLSMLDATLRLTPAQRAERHYHARLFAQRLRRLARERYGSAVDG